MPVFVIVELREVVAFKQVVFVTMTVTLRGSVIFQGLLTLGGQVTLGGNVTLAWIMLRSDSSAFCFVSKEDRETASLFEATPRLSTPAANSVSPGSTGVGSIGMRYTYPE